MAELFRRRAALTAGIGGGRALRIVNLDFEFSVVKNLRREPNTAEIKVYNLQASSRQALEANEEQRIRLEVGYETDVHVIFEGDLRKASSTRDGADIITTIEGGDGERSFRRARTNRSFGEGTSVRSVIEDVARGITRSIGLEWSVQDGNLQLLPFQTALRQTAVLLTKDTGLVGSPSLDSENVLTARSLIVPGIFPGRKVDVRSEFVRGIYRVTKATYIGSTFGNEWYVEVEGRSVDA
jgi:hypothetical protein